jgi:hypothetical protein
MQKFSQKIHRLPMNLLGCRRYVLGFKDYMNLGAGEGIRTLDPNLGKVVLYP